jgi:hypothetical protein
MLFDRIVTVSPVQPGTTQTPIPASGVPAYVPVVCNITSDHAALIAKQTANKLAWETKIFAALSQINNSIRAIDEYQKALPSLIAALETPIQNIAATKGYDTFVNGAKSSNQIKTNNFKMEAKGENPVLPPKPEQYLEVIKDSLTFNSVARSTVAATEFLTSATVRVTNVIQGTESYSTISRWVEGVIKDLKSIILPPGLQAIEQNAKTIAGNGIL